MGWGGLGGLGGGRMMYENDIFDAGEPGSKGGLGGHGWRGVEDPK